MASFTRAYEEWEDLDKTAKQLGCAEARILAEQARIGLAHHPAVNKARGRHAAFDRNHQGRQS